MGTNNRRKPKGKGEEKRREERGEGWESPLWGEGSSQKRNAQGKRAQTNKQTLPFYIIDTLYIFQRSGPKTLP